MSSLGRRKRVDASQCHDKLDYALKLYERGDLRQAHLIVSEIYGEGQREPFVSYPLDLKIRVMYHLFRYEIEISNIYDEIIRNRLKDLLQQNLKLTLQSDSIDAIIYKGNIISELTNIINKEMYIYMEDDICHDVAKLQQSVQIVLNLTTMLADIQKYSLFDIDEHRLGDIICSAKFVIAQLNCFIATAYSSEYNQFTDEELKIKSYNKDPVKDKKIKNKISDVKYIEVLSSYPELFNLQKKLCPKSVFVEMRICLLFLLLTKQISSESTSDKLKNSLSNAQSRGIDQNLIENKKNRVVQLRSKKNSVPFCVPRHSGFFRQEHWTDLVDELAQEHDSDVSFLLSL